MAAADPLTLVAMVLQLHSLRNSVKGNSLFIAAFVRLDDVVYGASFYEHTSEDVWLCAEIKRPQNTREDDDGSNGVRSE